MGPDCWEASRLLQYRLPREIAAQGVSKNQGHQYKPEYAVILVVGTPKRRPSIFGNSASARFESFLEFIWATVNPKGTHVRTVVVAVLE